MRILSLVLIGALFGTGVARADWIALRDGRRIESRGRWEVRGGRYLVYADAATGQMKQMNLFMVDLAESGRLKDAVARGLPLPPPSPRRLLSMRPRAPAPPRQPTPVEMLRKDLEKALSGAHVACAGAYPDNLAGKALCDLKMDEIARGDP